MIPQPVAADVCGQRMGTEHSKISKTIQKERIKTKNKE